MYDLAVSSTKKSVAIIGASGYAGVELLRLIAGHPDYELAWATGDSQSGVAAASLYPSLASAYPDLVFRSYEPSDVEGLDLVFLALPHGKSQEIVPDLRKRVPKIVDLAADFRLRDPGAYPIWYGEEHQCPERLEESVLGIPELFRNDIKASSLVAAAGCWVTAASLAIAPLVRHRAIERTGVIVDAASGVSGAGRNPKHANLYGTVAENFEAYGLLNHRHTPEIEQATGAEVLFTPHLAPMTRGILATCYARPTGRTSTAQLLALLRGVYSGEPFVVVTDEPPATKSVYGTNVCHITARYDERTGHVLVLSAIDNLVKGAAGQALQCANLTLGIDETAGLPIVGVYP